MTRGPETLQDEKEVDAPESISAGVDLSLLWLWPVLLLQAIIETFAGHAAQLKAMRRKTFRHPEPCDWAMHVENLRTAEWMVRAYLAREAQKLLSGEPLTLADTWVPVTPPGWRRPEPKSVREHIGRFEAISRVFANPMRHVARYARKLVKAALAADPRQVGILSATPAACASCTAPAAPFAASWTRGIPAPP